MVTWNMIGSGFAPPAQFPRPNRLQRRSPDFAAGTQRPCPILTALGSTSQLVATLTSEMSSSQAFAPGLPSEDSPARMRTMAVPSGTFSRVLTRVQSVVPVTGLVNWVVAPPIIFLFVPSSFQNCAMMKAVCLTFSVFIQPESSYVSPAFQPVASDVQL